MKYVLAILILVPVVILIILHYIKIRDNKRLLKLYNEISYSWQDINAMIILGKKYELLEESFISANLYYFYTQMECSGDFDFLVDEELIKSLSLDYDSWLSEAPIISQGLYLYEILKRKHPSLLPRISSAIKVRKKAGGQEVKIKNEETDLKPVFE